MNRVLYIGWVGLKNIGDELMLEIFRDLFYKYLDSSKYELIPTYDYIYTYNLNDYDTIVLGGGSILLDGYIDVLYDAMISGKKIIVWGSGYDWAEKDFIDLLDNSSDPIYLYPESTELKLNKLVEKTKFFGVRGPLTYKLLENSFIDTSNVIISGDPCFMLKPKELYEYTPILKLSEDDNIVAINWGTCLNRIYGQNEDAIERTLVDICKNLILSGYKIYIYIMWENDIAACTRIYEQLNDNENVILDINLYCAGQIINILKKCKFSINLKLHANIISAVSKIPFICLGYRFKAMDFAKSINCEELVVFTDSLDIKREIYNKISYIVTNYESIVNKLDSEILKYDYILDEPFKKQLF